MRGPAGAKGDPGFRIDLRPTRSRGAYPARGVAGTDGRPRRMGDLGSPVRARAVPAGVEALLDPAVTAGIRTRVDFNLTPTTAQARRLFTYGRTSSPRFVRSADVDRRRRDVVAASATPSASAPPGEPRWAPRPRRVRHRAPRLGRPGPAARRGETDAGYLPAPILDGAALTVGCSCWRRAVSVRSWPR